MPNLILQEFAVLVAHDVALLQTFSSCPIVIKNKLIACPLNGRDISQFEVWIFDLIWQNQMGENTEFTRQPAVL